MSRFNRILTAVSLTVNGMPTLVSRLIFLTRPKRDQLNFATIYSMCKRVNLYLLLLSSFEHEINQNYGM